MREELKPRTAAGVLALFAAAVALFAADQVDYLNGVPYVFPASQGAADKVLTNDGTGALSWAAPPNASGLWTQGIVLSTVACPAGWTRVSAGDDRMLRGAPVGYGGTGGSNTHGHTVDGVSGATAVSIAGSTGSTSPGVSGSTGTTSVSHSHGWNGGGTPTGVGGAAVNSITVQSADPSHSHSKGTLAGGSHSHGSSFSGASHGHGPGSFAGDSATAVAAWYDLILCAKD
jgi:hypothetical protein